jgi:hypothetical protein
MLGREALTFRRQIEQAFINLIHFCRSPASVCLPLGEGRGAARSSFFAFHLVIVFLLFPLFIGEGNLFLWFYFCSLGLSWLLHQKL